MCRSGTPRLLSTCAANLRTFLPPLTPRSDTSPPEHAVQATIQLPNAQVGRAGRERRHLEGTWSQVQLIYTWNRARVTPSSCPLLDSIATAFWPPLPSRLGPALSWPVTPPRLVCTLPRAVGGAGVAGQRLERGLVRGPASGRGGAVGGGGGGAVRGAAVQVRADGRDGIVSNEGRAGSGCSRRAWCRSVQLHGLAVPPPRARARPRTRMLRSCVLRHLWTQRQRP